MNCGLKSFVIFAIPTRIKKKLHAYFSLFRLWHNQETCQIQKIGRSALYGGQEIL
jgi:hypothetical protein